MLKRGAREIAVDGDVADLPEVSAPKVAVLKELELVTLTPAIRAERGIRSPRGALIYNLSDRDLRRARARRRAIVIVQINHMPIETRERRGARARLRTRGAPPSTCSSSDRASIYSTDFVIR